MARDILDSYKILVAFLGDALGPDYEIVLQDLRDQKNCIVAIANGHISGRKIGDSITDASLELLSKRTYIQQDYHANYKGVTKDETLIRASTMFIKNDLGEPIALLCINFDDSRFIELHDQLLSIAHPIEFLKQYSTHTISHIEMYDSYNSTDNITEQFTSDINVLMNNMYHQVIETLNLPLDRLTQEERITIVGKLNEQSFFKLKGAVQYAAKQLRCSSASIYRYLNELKNN